MVLELFEDKSSLPLSSYPKIALVKQFVYADLYSKNKNDSLSNWLETIYTSNHRSGPMGIFSKLESDFFIVDVFEDDFVKFISRKG
jgi:hypothetical protein